MNMRHFVGIGKSIRIKVGQLDEVKAETISKSKEGNKYLAFGNSRKPCFIHFE